MIMERLDANACGVQGINMKISYLFAKSMKRDSPTGEDSQADEPPTA